MRLGLVIYGSLDTLSGGYLYDRMLVRQLALAGCSVQLVSLPWRNYASHLADNLRLDWIRRLAALEVDLLLQDELNHPSLLATNWRLRRRMCCSVVSIVHHLRSSETHPAPLLRLYRWVERHYLRSVDGFLFNSQTTRRSVESLARSRQPAHVAYPAADHLPGPDRAPHEIARRAQAAGPLRILFVGNLIPRKGLHTLLAAVAQVDRSLWTLTIVGRTDVNSAYAKHIGATIAAMGAGASVTLAGRLSDVELVDAYCQHQLLAVPSYEGFGIVYLEAMRWGLPVLAVTVGAAGEIVTPGLDGLLVPPDAPQLIAGHLRDLSLDRSRLLTMSLAARQRYLRHPTWAQSMGAACDWLATLVN